MIFSVTWTVFLCMGLTCELTAVCLMINPCSTAKRTTGQRIMTKITEAMLKGQVAQTQKATSRLLTPQWPGHPLSTQPSPAQGTGIAKHCCLGQEEEEKKKWIFLGLLLNIQKKVKKVHFLIPPNGESWPAFRTLGRTEGRAFGH